MSAARLLLAGLGLAGLALGGQMIWQGRAAPELEITLGRDAPAEPGPVEAPADAATTIAQTPPLGESDAGAAQTADPQPLFRTPAPADDGRPARLARADELACAQCHAAIVDEWATSLHAMAWVDERYQTAMLKKSRPASCQGCHIPEPLFAGAIGRKYAPRADVTTPRPSEGDAALAWDPRHMGISCVSCHRAPDGAMLGPFESAPDDEISSAHASRQDAAFVLGSPAQDTLCINCHRTTVGPVIGIAKGYELTDQADKGLSCIGCHFAPVERAHAEGTTPQGEPWSAPVRKGRSHALQTPRDPYYLSLAFGLTAAATDRGATLTIKNQAAHRVPGLRTRSMTFRATAYDAAGAAIGESEHRVASDDFLDIDDAVAVPVQFVGSAARFRVRAWHAWEGVEEPLLFVDRDLELAR